MAKAWTSVALADDVAREALFRAQAAVSFLTKGATFASGVRMNDLQLHEIGRRHFLTGERAFSAG